MPAPVAAALERGRAKWEKLKRDRAADRPKLWAALAAAVGVRFPALHASLGDVPNWFAYGRAHGIDRVVVALDTPPELAPVLVVFSLAPGPRWDLGRWEPPDLPPQTFGVMTVAAEPFAHVTVWNGRAAWLYADDVDTALAAAEEAGAAVAERAARGLPAPEVPRAASYYA